VGLFGKKDETLGEVDECITANQIVSNPELINSIKRKYVLVYNVSATDVKFNDLSKAINLMAEKDWRCLNICSYTVKNAMYALMERNP
jgi:hypothetical protein